MPEKVCEHCGAKIVEYKHGLSKGLIRVLYHIIRECEGQPQEFEFCNIKLTYNEGSNFQKLRYWKLIEKVGDFDGKGGTWKLTARGISFARGEISLPKFAMTYRGELVSHEGDNVKVYEVVDGWRFRPDYASEAVPHELL
jgi:hypothetical protein